MLACLCVFVVACVSLGVGKCAGAFLFVDWCAGVCRRW